MQTLLGNYRIFIFITLIHWALSLVAFTMAGSRAYAVYSEFERFAVDTLETLAAIPLAATLPELTRAEHFWTFSMVNSAAFSLVFLLVINLYSLVVMGLRTK